MKSFSLQQHCYFVHLSECPPPSGAIYSCAKEPQIDTFFHEDFVDYEQQLLGNTYGYYSKETSNLVAAFTIANSALVLDFLQSSKKNKINRDIPRVKQRRQYPALLLCQVAVFDEYAKYRLGDELIEQIKRLALLLNKTTACRYLIVEAVNKQKVLDFYERNGFVYLYSSEQDEINKTNRKLNSEDQLPTRLMMYDLLRYTLTPTNG